MGWTEIRERNNEGANHSGRRVTEKIHEVKMLIEEILEDAAEMEELYGERNGYGERSYYGERGNYGERGGEGYGERRMRDGRGRYTTNY